MSFKQRAAIDFCVKLGKTFTETHQMPQNAYGDDCLSRTQVYEWFGRFKSGRETLEMTKEQAVPEPDYWKKTSKKCMNSSKITKNRW